MVNHFKRIKRIAEKHHRQAVASFHTTHRHAKRLLNKHKVTVHKIRTHAVRSTAIAGVSMSVLAAPVLAATPAARPALPSAQDLQQQLIQDQVAVSGQVVSSPVTTVSDFGPSRELANKKGQILSEVSDISPTYSNLLTQQQEDQFSQLIQKYYGISAKAELDGMRLNATQGVIAGEQHLPLYPGDTLANHTSDPTARLTGMVPGLPSWGYFATNKQSVTQKMIEEERYYIAAQTWLSPGWTAQKNSWYKYRKMIMLAPDYDGHTVHAVVVDIGDAGPSPFLSSVVDGRQYTRTFGGSNEVLMGLGLGIKRVGHVFAFFVDDPQDKVPLGPIGTL